VLVGDEGRGGSGGDAGGEGGGEEGGGGGGVGLEGEVLGVEC